MICVASTKLLLIKDLAQQRLLSRLCVCPLPATGCLKPSLDPFPYALFILAQVLKALCPNLDLCNINK